MVACVACFPGPERAPEARLGLSRTPSGTVGPEEPVAFRWEEAFVLSARPAVRSSAQALTAQVELGVGRVQLFPAPSWPVGARIEVDFGGAFATAEGRSLEVPVAFFDVAAGPSEPEGVRLNLPRSGATVPPNLRWLEADLAEADGGFLESDDGDRVDLRRADPGFVEVDTGGRCDRLCPGQVYRLSGVEGPQGPFLRTSTSADTRPPKILEVSAKLEPGRLRLLVRSDETVRGRVQLGEAPRLNPVASSPGWLDLSAAAEPFPRSNVEVRLDVEDLAGAKTSTRFHLQAPPELALRITELVPTALRDWGDSEPSLEPFDPWPGTGSVTSADEWVEIVNLGSEPLDLTAVPVELRVLDRTPSATRLERAPGAFFGDGGSARDWRPGEALVVRPRGDMAQRDVMVELWGGAILLDRVLLAQRVEADHAGGAPPALEFEAIGLGRDGRFAWCVPSPGDPRPAERCHQP